MDSLEAEEEYIEDYKGYAIAQDMADGYFLAYDDDEVIIAREDTPKMLKWCIDNSYFLPNAKG